MSEILKLSLGDFFTKTFLKFALLPLFCSFVLCVIAGYFGFSYLLEYFNDLFSASDTNSSFLAWLYSFMVVQAIISLLVFVFASSVVVLLSLVFALCITAFLTPFICKKINAKYYQQKLIKPVSFYKVSFRLFLLVCKFILLLCCAVVLWFVPFINLFIFYLVFYYLFHKMLVLDVTSCVLESEDFENLQKNGTSLDIKFITLCFYLISLVPLLGFFLQVFFVIFLAHFFYRKNLKDEAQKRLLEQKSVEI